MKTDTFSSPSGTVSHRLIKGTFITFLGFVFLKGMRFILVPLYTRYLSPADYGILGIFLPLVEILSMLATLGLNSSIIFFMFEYREKEEEYKKFISTILISNIVFALIISVLFFAISPAFLKIFLKENIHSYKSYIILIIGIILFVIPQQIMLSILQAREKRLEIAILNIAGFLLLFIFLIYQLVVKKSGAYGQILASFYQSIVLFVPYFTYLFYTIGRNFRYSLHYLTEAIKYSLPLLPHSISLWILNLSDRLILSKYAGLEETGYYTFAYTCGLAMYAFVTGMQAVWSPVFFDVKKNQKDANLILGAQASHWTLFLGIIAGTGILFTPEIVKIIASQKYWIATPYIIPVILGYFFNGIYTFPGLILQQMKRTGLVSILTIIAASSNIFFNLIFVPRYGAIAASWSTAGCFFLLSFLYYFFGMKLNPINIIWKEWMLGILIPILALPLSLLTIEIKIIIFAFVLILSFKLGIFKIWKRIQKKL